MITIKNGHLIRGDKTLFTDANFTLYAGQKVGIIGKNGSGKSSFFKLLLGELHLDLGELEFPQNMSLTHLEQEMPDSEDSVLSYTLAGNQALQATYQALAEAEVQEDGHKMGELHQKLLDLGAYEAESKAAKVLRGLGFSHEAQSKPVNAFSGGWRMRLNLARALLADSDLLLLDEPTNHLDFEAIMWLEEWLGRSQQTILLISHDRELLDHVTTHIVQFDQQRLKLWTGNYSTFEKELALQRQVQQATFEKQQQHKTHLESFINRFRAKATKAKQAQSRIKQLEKMTFVDPVEQQKAFQFNFEDTGAIGNPVVSLEQVSLSYPNGPTLFTHLNFGLNEGDRLALLGPNGAGKSTLVKLIAGTLMPTDGTVFRNPKAKIGYFHQNLVEKLDLTSDAFTHLHRQAPKLADSAIRTYLGRFNFHGDEVFRPLAEFSGGERVRLALALLVYNQPNLLLMDEPTNHLDMDMREALAFALQAFTGTLVVVSHDRHFLKLVCDDLWLVHDQMVQRFAGDLDDYCRWSLTQASDPPTQANKKQPQLPRKEKPKANLKKLQQALKKKEQELKQVEQALADIESQLADPSFYTTQSATEQQKTHQHHQALKQQKETLEDEVLVMMEEIEAAR